MTQRILILLALMLSGCVELDPADDLDADLATDEVEQALSGYIAAAPANNSQCGWSGGQYWCQDYYTGKWCTGSSQLTVDWDYVPSACDWNGRGTGEYCHNGVCANCWYGTPSNRSDWFYWLAHHHCP